MQTSELESIIDRGEDTKVDYKTTLKFSEKPVRAELVRDLLSIVNAHGEMPGYLIIGWDESTYSGHDVGPLGLDDGSLHSFVDEYTEPPIPFEFRHVQAKGVTMGVFVVQPSHERFHLVKKDLSDSSKTLLTRGETWIRRGARKDRLTAWDFKRLKEDHVRLFHSRPEPVLEVTFDDGTLEQARNSKTGIRTSLAELPDDSWRFTTHDLRMRIKNVGRAGADNIFVSIVLPDGLDPFISLSPKSNPNAPWRVDAPLKSKVIKVEGNTLVHGVHFLIPFIKVVMDDPGKVYEIAWTARAANMPEATSGVLRVLPEQQDEESTESTGI